MTVFVTLKKVNTLISDRFKKYLSKKMAVVIIEEISDANYKN